MLRIEPHVHIVLRIKPQKPHCVKDKIPDPYCVKDKTLPPRCPLRGSKPTACTKRVTDAFDRDAAKSAGKECPVSPKRLLAVRGSPVMGGKPRSVWRGTSTALFAGLSRLAHDCSLKPRHVAAHRPGLSS